jgi:hypothetical protein
MYCMKVTMKFMLLVSWLGLFGCSSKKKDVVFEKFKSEIEKHELKIDSVDNTGLIYISKDSNTLKISLDNARKNFVRDSDETHITDLVNTILSYSEALPEWSIAKDAIYISLFPNDYDFQDSLHKTITEEFSKVYVYSGNDKLTWITSADLKEWRITENELDKQAGINTQLMLNKAKLSFDTIENRKIGFLEVEHESLKSALLFAPNIKEKVSKDFGFPFYAVIPVRDFCYIFSEKNFDFFSKRLGTTIVGEYKESGYPITTEILKFSDKGVEAVGRYPVGK